MVLKKTPGAGEPTPTPEPPSEVAAPVQVDHSSLEKDDKAELQLKKNKKATKLKIANADMRSEISRDPFSAAGAAGAAAPAPEPAERAPLVRKVEPKAAREE